MNKKIIFSMLVLLVLIFSNPIKAENCIPVFSDNFDIPNEEKWIEENNAKWGFEDGFYVSKMTDIDTVYPATTANIEDIASFIAEVDFLPIGKFFGISIRSPVNDYPLIGLFSTSKELYIAAFPKTIYPLLGRSEIIEYTTNTNTWYKVKLKSEETQIKAKVWPRSETEPGDWMLTLNIDNLFFSQGKISLRGGQDTKFDNFQILPLDCETTPISEIQGCQESIFSKKSFLELKSNCLMINPKQGFYRFIYTYDSSNNVNIIEPENCGSYSCSFATTIELPLSVKKVAVYNNEIKDWVEKDV